ncbi:DUF1232 domain-containing protein [Treponema sp. OMZ 788]|uniref:YkvA family protein n=1 Tax=Treponema sp. OMZ 788 TaxID=2563664 RepID=UPI0020A2F733|nr:YkvA family protein [Treponema sp. OMZ 788]UTC64534.1 DUF1232 domain-containing protein [Treponema sp. OMZ 788]
MGFFTKADEAKINGMFNSIKQGRFSNNDTSTVINNTVDILSKSSHGPLSQFFDDIKTMCAMAKAWTKKDYREIPFKTIGMIILTLVYVFSPVDIIPDVIPGVGLLDDAAIVGLCIAAARNDINDFRIWASHHKHY